MVRFRNGIAVVVFVAIAQFVMTNQVHAASITVNSSADTATQDDGDCTLREAINNVNAQSDTTDGGLGGDCTAADGSTDTITLPATTILLTSDLPQITESVTINGQGMGQTVIDGGGAWSALMVDLTTGQFSLSQLTVSAFSTAGVRVVDADSVTISQLEIDGDRVVAPGGYGVALSVDTDSVIPANVSISDAYIHDFDVDASSIFQILLVTASGRATMNASVDRVTIARIRNTGSIQTALFGPTNPGIVGGSEQYTARVSNMTIHDVASENSMAMAAVIANINNVGSSPILYLRNTTIDSIAGADGVPLTIPLVGVAGGAINQGDIASATLIASNLVVSRAAGSTTNCGVVDISALIGGSGSATGSLSSLGGNLSDDTSCSSYFTQPTDQNNITNLSSFLEALADNGGSVPTMALKQGSPAIDAGITIAGLTTDARGIARPQGLAYDAGAYESPYTRQTTSASLASTGEGKLSFIILGAVLIAVSATTAVVAIRRRA